MNKMKTAAAALAAVFTFAVAPVFETGLADTSGLAGTNGVTGISWSRPVCPVFAEGNGVDYQLGLHYIPLVTRTEHRVDSDGKGDLLRARWTGIRVTGPVPFEPNINKALDAYTAKEDKQFAESYRKMLSDLCAPGRFPGGEPAGIRFQLYGRRPWHVWFHRQNL